VKIARSVLARAREALDGGEQVLALLGRHVGVSGGECVGDAVADVVFEQLDRDAFQGGRDGGDLGEDVDAVALPPSCTEENSNDGFGRLSSQAGVVVGTP
jgi:hypothetical protein